MIKYQTVKEILFWALLVIITILLVSGVFHSTEDKTPNIFSGTITSDMYVPELSQKLTDRDFVTTNKDSLFVYQISWDKISDSKIVQFRVSPDSTKYAWWNVTDFEIMSSGGIRVKNPFHRKIGYHYKIILGE